jgi:hypothetical protein
MTESASGLRELFFGLEEYFADLDHQDELIMTRELGRVYDQEQLGASLFIALVKILHLRSQDPDSLGRALMDYCKKDYDLNQVKDAMSRSQIRSKIWLRNQLTEISDRYTNVALMAGWFGQLRFILGSKIHYENLRIIELDRRACEVSDYVFNVNKLENYRVKAVNQDINKLTLHRNGYQWPVENFREGTSYEEKFLPDLIINTSAEHMTEQWFFQLRHKGLERPPIVAIQSNNLFDIPEHVNCVHSQDHMLKKFPMSEVLYAGELQLKGYKRVMIIGRP